ncbi:MAG: hypothetical protein AAGG68_27030 [Bacteroidota bacterium]
MKALKLGLFSFLILTLFANCEKEEALTNEFTPLSEEQKATNFLIRAKHTILFAALEMNHEEGSVNGFIIDKNANLRSLEMDKGMSHKFDQQLMPEYTMLQLHERSTYVEALDPIEVADMLKKAYTLSNESVAEKTEESSTTSQLYYSFKVNDSEPNGDCEGEEHHQTYYQLLIDAKGKLEGQNIRKGANDLLTWLQSFEENDVDGQGK